MKRITILLLAGALAVSAATSAAAQTDPPPFGGPADVSFANQFWAAMTEARLVGPNALKTAAYQGGTGLHATTLTALQGMVAVEANNGLAIVKNNFAGAEGKDVTDADIIERPQDFGGPTTVMYQRKGFDLGRTDLTGANLTNANLIRTHIEDTDLTAAIGLTQAQLRLACGNANTKLPAGFTVKPCLQGEL